jgi:putative pyruvate formate lyase activating enzyme
MNDVIASYLTAFENGTLQRRIDRGLKALTDCRLCPRQCGVNRVAGETGYCRTGRQAVVASYNAHFGEETPLVGQHGSGTIFFTHCNLKCLFCQNYEISHLGQGHAVTDDQLADIMLDLQAVGCHNINLVTPSHVVPQVLSAVGQAARQGLTLPLVYNCGGYDRVDTLQLLEGIVDIYMPDFKFWDAEVAAQTCDAPDYPETARRALLEMHGQVGDLVIDEATGLAGRGLLVRHLVMPRGMAGTPQVMAFLAESLSPDTYVNLMAQYRPCGRAGEIDSLAAALSPDEYRRAVQAARDAGITRLHRRRRVFQLG